MNVTSEARHVCFVRCPGCLNDVPAADGPSDPQAPFRCTSCRRRRGEMIPEPVAEPMKGKVVRGKRQQSDSLDPNPVAVAVEDRDGD